MGDDKEREWETREVKADGDVGDVVQQGGGKVSTDNPEPGELPTKPPGQ